MGIEERQMIPRILHFVIPETATGDQRLGEILPDEAAEGSPSTSVFSAEKLVQAISLDELIPFDAPFKLLKIDAEGHEPEVLEGARRHISAGNIRYIMIEVSMENHGVEYKTMSEKLRWLCEQGYTPNYISPDGTLTSCTNPTRLAPALGHVNVVFKYS